MPQKASQGNVTTDHTEIRKWVESHGGHPATVKRTARAREPGILRIDYEGFSGEDSLERISWREFFKKFDENNLAFLYQDKKKDGSDSRFSKLVKRETAEEGSTRPRGRATSKTGSKRATSKRGQSAASGRAASGRASSGRAASGRASSGRAASGRASSGRATSGRASSGRAASGRASSGRATQGRAR